MSNAGTLADAETAAPPHPPGGRRPRLKRFSGWLSPPWYDLLEDVADRECRTVDQQVSWYVREALAHLRVPFAGAADAPARPATASDEAATDA